MLQRLYVHNFRCFENFEFNLKGISSSLLIGGNGSGKSTVGDALGVFQKLGRGINRVGQLVTPSDFSYGRSEAPIRFEIEVVLRGGLYLYSLALELPEKFKQLRVLEERLEVDGRPVYTRQQAQVSLPRNSPDRNEARFSVDWHLIALPLIQDLSEMDPLRIFKNWLAQMVILSPIPQSISGESTEESLQPLQDGSNLGDWLSGLLSQYPAAYSTISDYLRDVMPDFFDFRNEILGKEAKRLLTQFVSDKAKFLLPFGALSAGEKCFFLSAVVVAANKAYGPLFCFWDEPDNFLSLSEVGHFVMELRRTFEQGGQVVMTSHNPEAIRRFSSENTWVLDRKNHLEPTLIRLLEELPKSEDLVQAWIAGDIAL
ncbi:MAG: AAA family ATPase [Candidatus Contendobacter sp.]|nr:MAG: AAA family ATPase [Candidatus Contendobacter sp.]